MSTKPDAADGGGRSPRPKVLWVSKGLNRGGAEVLLLTLAGEQALRGFELHVATVMGTHVELEHEFAALGIPVHNLGAKSTFDPRWLLRLLRLVRFGDFSVIHSHSPLPASTVRLIRGSKRAPRVVSTEHAMRDLYGWPTRILNDLTGHLDDARFVVSRAAAQTYPASSDLEVMYHGIRIEPASINVADEAEMRSECNASEDDKIVLAIANFRPEKNIELLVRSFARTVVDHPNALLVVIGDGTCMASVEHAVARVGIAHRVRLIGRRREAWRYLRIASVFALSSDREGLPVSVMEAMAMGVPVVATNVGGVAEVVEHGVSGFLVDRGDEVGLARCMDDLLASPEACVAMGRAGRLSLERFSSVQAAVRLSNRYQELLK